MHPECRCQLGQLVRRLVVLQGDRRWEDLLRQRGTKGEHGFVERGEERIA